MKHLRDVTLAFQNKLSILDLIVGSPESDGIVILLSRPVVDIDAQLLCANEIDALSPSCLKYSPGSSGCFNCSVCFSYNGLGITSNISKYMAYCLYISLYSINVIVNRKLNKTGKSNLARLKKRQ